MVHAGLPGTQAQSHTSPAVLPVQLASELHATQTPFGTLQYGVGAPHSASDVQSGSGAGPPAPARLRTLLGALESIVRTAGERNGREQTQHGKQLQLFMVNDTLSFQGGAGRTSVRVRSRQRWWVPRAAKPRSVTPGRSA